MAGKSPRLEELREAFARRTHTSAQDWFPVFKARYGMREVFRAAADVHGDGSVVTTLFTGCTAVDSIISAGLSPRYDAIDPATLTVDTGALVLGASVRAVILQNSYGIIDERASAECAVKTHEAGALFMEDSAHCVMRMARDAEGRPLADVSIHSLGIEKQFSIGFGGLVWVNPDMPDAALHERLVSSLSSLDEPPARLGRNARRYGTQNRVLVHLPGSLGRALRAWLTQTGRLEPPVAAVEQRGQLPYPSYLPSAEITERILAAVPGIDEDEAMRRVWVNGYARALEGRKGISIPAGALGVGRTQPLTRFPIILSSEPQARELIDDLRSRGFYCVDWYRVPFYPGATDLAAYNMSETDEAYRSFRETYGGIVGLPTDLDPSRQKDAVEIVLRHLG